MATQQFVTETSTPNTLLILLQPENAVIEKQRDEILLETATKETELPLFTNSFISLYSWEKLKRIGENINVTNQNFSETCSVNDPRMGVLSTNFSCQYCSQIDCSGHYGLIEFGHPNPRRSCLI